MNPLLLAGLIGGASALAVLWPYHRIPCRLCLAITWVVIVGGSVAAYEELGSPRLLPKLDVSAQLNGEMRARLAAHMQAVAARPQDPAEWRNFGRDLMIIGRYGEAAAAYGRAYQYDQEADTLFDALTAHYLSAGGVIDDSALPLLRFAEQRFPALAKTRYYAALRLKAQGRLAESRRELLALQPELPAGDPLAVLIAEEIARSGAP